MHRLDLTVFKSPNQKMKRVAAKVECGEKATLGEGFFAINAGGV
jgi:hypothetical protein